MSKILSVQEDRILEAAESCPQAKEILKKIFPESFHSQASDFPPGTFIEAVGIKAVVMDAATRNILVKHYSPILGDSVRKYVWAIGLSTGGTYDWDPKVVTIYKCSKG